MPMKFDVNGISENKVNGRYIRQEAQCGGTYVYRLSRMAEGTDGTRDWSEVANEDGILFRVETETETEGDDILGWIGLHSSDADDGEAEGESDEDAEPQGHWAVNLGYHEVVEDCSQASGTNYAYS